VQFYSDPFFGTFPKVIAYLDLEDV
jgi:hypothetical protein